MDWFLCFFAGYFLVSHQKYIYPFDADCRNPISNSDGKCTVWHSWRGFRHGIVSFISIEIYGCRRCENVLRIGRMGRLSGYRGIDGLLHFGEWRGCFSDYADQKKWDQAIQKIWDMAQNLCTFAGIYPNGGGCGSKRQISIYDRRIFGDYRFLLDWRRAMNQDFLIWQVSSEKSEFRQINQDAFFAASCKLEGAEYGIFCIADGMGGVEKGELASTLAAAEIEKWFEADFAGIISEDADPRRMRQELYCLLKAINAKILQRYTYQNISAGTTLSLLLLTPTRYFIAHCGDSRIYAVEREQIRQLTEDHTAVNFMKKMGRPAENCYRENVLSSCIGMMESPEIQTDFGLLHQKTGFILTSDGVYRFVSEEEFLDESGEIQEAKTLTELALCNQGNDNATAITVILSSRQKAFYTKWKSHFGW